MISIAVEIEPLEGSESLGEFYPEASSRPNNAQLEASLKAHAQSYLNTSQQSIISQDELLSKKIKQPEQETKDVCSDISIFVDSDDAPEKTKSADIDHGLPSGNPVQQTLAIKNKHDYQDEFDQKYREIIQDYYKQQSSRFAESKQQLKEILQVSHQKHPTQQLRAPDLQLSTQAIETNRRPRDPSWRETNEGSPNDPPPPQSIRIDKSEPLREPPQPPGQNETPAQQITPIGIQGRADQGY